MRLRRYYKGRPSALHMANRQARIHRAAQRELSNNPNNTNKNWCALRVAQACGVADATRYLHTISDIKRALATRWNYRSRKSAFKATTVKQYQKAIANKAIEAGLSGYVVIVQGHVLLLNKQGEVHVDTAPEHTSRKPVQQIYGLFYKR